MRIKLKDIELAIKKIRSNSMAESVEVDFGPDNISIMLEFTDKSNNIAKAKLFDANINVTPEIISTQKLYQDD